MQEELQRLAIAAVNYDKDGVELMLTVIWRLYGPATAGELLGTLACYGNQAAREIVDEAFKDINPHWWQRKPRKEPKNETVPSRN